MSGLADIINSGINTPTANGTILSGIINQIQGTKTAPITPALKAAGAKGQLTEPSKLAPTKLSPSSSRSNTSKSAAPAGVKLNLSNMNTPPQQTLPQPSNIASMGLEQSTIPQGDVGKVASAAVDAIINGYKGGLAAIKEGMPEQKAALDKYAKTLDEVNQDIKKMPTIPVMKSYQEITQKTREMFPLLTGIMAIAFSIFGKGSMSNKLNSFGQDYSAMAQGLQQYNLKKFAIATQDWQNKVKEWQATTNQTLQKYNEFLQSAMTGVGIEKAKAGLLQEIPQLNMQTGQQLSSLLNGLSMINYRVEGLKLRMFELQQTMTKNLVQENYYNSKGKEADVISNKLDQESQTTPQANSAKIANYWQSLADKIYAGIQKGEIPSEATIDYNQQQGMPAPLANDLRAAIKNHKNGATGNGIPTVNTNQMNGQ